VPGPHSGLKVCWSLLPRSAWCPIVLPVSLFPVARIDLLVIGGPRSRTSNLIKRIINAVFTVQPSTLPSLMIHTLYEGKSRKGPPGT
jgi:hypothetical protein